MNIGIIASQNRSVVPGSGLSPATIDTAPFTATTQFSGVTKNMMVRYPEGYDQNDNHNCLIFLHGIGEFGTTANEIWLNGFAKEIQANNTTILNELDRLGIVAIFPQQPSQTFWGGGSGGDGWSEPYLLDIITWAKTLKIDKITVGGLSMGGGGAVRLAYENYTEFYKVLAMCPQSSTSYASIYAENLPVWVFHGQNDSMTGFGSGASSAFIDAIKDYIAANPGTGIYPPKFSYITGGDHSSAWIKPSQEIGFAASELSLDIHGNGKDPAGLTNGVGILDWCFN